ncbi:hypothetical protein SLA2020_139090 [Shorea laevis]
MEPRPSGGFSPTRKRNGVRDRTRIDSLDHDILHIIFSFLNIFDLVRCTVVCKSWPSLGKCLSFGQSTTSSSSSEVRFCSAEDRDSRFLSLATKIKLRLVGSKQFSSGKEVILGAPAMLSSLREVRESKFHSDIGSSDLHNPRSQVTIIVEANHL